MTESQIIPQPQVATDEMAFAIALFVAAANGRIAPPEARTTNFSLGSSARLNSDPLLLGASAILGEKDQPASDEVPLACAVSVLWHHYERDERQQAICARLVAFYALMVRSRGALLEPWTQDSDLDPQSVILAPAIVEAVATASLGPNGQFRDAEFKALVQSLAERDVTPKAPVVPNKLVKRVQKAAATLPVTDVVRQLSHHLVAFQACVAAVPDAEGTPQFRAVEELCGRIAAISGSTTLQTILSRALLASRLDFPWLQSATASNLGALEGLDQIQPPPDFQEAMRCEMAILGSLIELLRSFLGDALTVQLLRSLWPLATLDDGSAKPPSTVPKT